MEKMPRARKRGLIVRDVDDETLIYDQLTDKAYCLNQTAAKVWIHCDGETMLVDACQELSRDLETTVDEKIVRYALAQFSQGKLLEEEITRPPNMNRGLNRREIVRTLGLAAALPLVTSIIAPTPAQAATCRPSGQACTTGIQCCSTLCNPMPPGSGICA